MAENEGQRAGLTYGEGWVAPPGSGVYMAGFPAGEGLVPLVPVLVVALLAVAHVRRRARVRGWPSTDTQFAALSDEAADMESWQIGRTLFCPICTDEYLAEADRCEDCGVQLVEEEDLTERTDARIEEGIVRILRIDAPSQAHMVRSLLSANRIPCTILRCTPCDVFGTDVFVFESDALRAKRLVRQFISESDLVSFR